MNFENKETSNDIRYRIYEAIIFLVLLMFIIFRIINYNNDMSSWVWIVNYLGMVVALLNLFIGKIISLYEENNAKYKAFAGFSFVLILFLILAGFKVSEMQTSTYVTFVNDVITLLALFFSLSQRIWDNLLERLLSIIN